MENGCGENSLPPQKTTTWSCDTRPIFKPSCIKLITMYLRHIQLVHSGGLRKLLNLLSTSGIWKRALQFSFAWKANFSAQDFYSKATDFPTRVRSQSNGKQWSLFHSHMESSQVCQENKLAQKKREQSFVAI